MSFPNIAGSELALIKRVKTRLGSSDEKTYVKRLGLTYEWDYVYGNKWREVIDLDFLINLFYPIFLE
ncbi:MAG: hypothetical protein RR386_00820 [Bacteroidaceae bacterium]